VNICSRVVDEGRRTGAVEEAIIGGMVVSPTSAATETG
jgi:hypothetical protein